jgi:uncharacterized RDD family membrane protein YckC
MKLAKISDRILAFMIDFLIYAFILFIFGYFFGEVNSEKNGFQITGFPALILFLIGIGLWPMHEAFTGQTFGKKIVGIKVVDKNFKEISGSMAFLRFGLGLFDCFFLIGLLIASSSKNNQRIGDSVAETYVMDINK